jgi:hypothetical protein
VSSSRVSFLSAFLIGKLTDVLRSKLGVNSRMEAGLKPALSGSAAGVGVPAEKVSSVPLIRHYQLTSSQSSWRKGRGTGGLCRERGLLRYWLKAGWCKGWRFDI